MQQRAFGVVGVLAALVIAGCAGEGITAPVDSPVAIETSDLFLTVRNVADGPLSDLTIGIKPTGVRPEYQTQVRGLAAGEELDIPYAEFRGIDRDALVLQNINPAVRPHHSDGLERRNARRRVALGVDSGPPPHRRTAMARPHLLAPPLAPIASPPRSAKAAW